MLKILYDELKLAITVCLLIIILAVCVNQTYLNLEQATKLLLSRNTSIHDNIQLIIITIKFALFYMAIKLTFDWFDWANDDSDSIFKTIWYDLKFKRFWGKLGWRLTK